MPSFRWVTTIYCHSRLDGHNKLNAGHGKAFTWAWIWRTTVWFHDLRNTNPGYTLPRCKWTFYQVYLQNRKSDLLNGENPWHLPSLTKQGIDSTENQIHAQLREVELPITTANVRDLLFLAPRTFGWSRARLRTTLGQQGLYTISSIKTVASNAISTDHTTRYERSRGLSKSADVPIYSSNRTASVTSHW